MEMDTEEERGLRVGGREREREDKTGDGVAHWKKESIIKGFLKSETLYRYSKGLCVYLHTHTHTYAHPPTYMHISIHFCIINVRISSNMFVFHRFP